MQTRGTFPELYAGEKKTASKPKKGVGGFSMHSSPRTHKAPATYAGRRAQSRFRARFNRG